MWTNSFIFALSYVVLFPRRIMLLSYFFSAVAILKEVCVEIKLTSEAWSRDFLTNTSFAFTDLGKKIESGVRDFS